MTWAILAWRPVIDHAETVHPVFSTTMQITVLNTVIPY